LKGRRSPRLYGLGLALGLPGIAALILYMIGVRAGFELETGPLAPWLIVETVSIAAAVGMIGSAVAQARQRRVDGWQDYNGPSPLLTLGALLALVTALELPLEVVLKSMSVDLESASATLAVVLVYLGAYVSLVHFLSVRTGAMTWHDVVSPARLAPSSDDWTGPGPAPGWRPNWAGAIGSWRSQVSGSRMGNVLVPLAMVLHLLIVSYMASALLMVGLGLHASDISPEIPTPLGNVDRLLTIVAVAIVAPIGEEIFFRGYVTNAWARSVSRNSAILRASLLFALVHVANVTTTVGSVSWRVALFDFGARIPVAIALTWLYMRRRSIIASATLHAGYNGAITLIAFLAS